MIKEIRLCIDLGLYGEALMLLNDFALLHETKYNDLLKHAMMRVMVVDITGNLTYHNDAMKIIDLLERRIERDNLDTNKMLDEAVKVANELA